MAVCRSIVRKDFLLMAMGGAVKLEMKMLSSAIGAGGELGSVRNTVDSASFGY
jgi:hypothetical protein